VGQVTEAWRKHLLDPVGQLTEAWRKHLLDPMGQVTEAWRKHLLDRVGQVTVLVSFLVYSMFKILTQFWHFTDGMF